MGLAGCNPSKVLSREVLMESLGYVTDGMEGWQDPPSGYLRDLIRLTFWLCASDKVSRRQGQVLAGRWVRAQQLRRATAGCFEQLWQWISRGAWGRPFPAAVREELLVACSLWPFLFANLRLGFDDVVSASDASELGLGVCISTG